MWLSNDFHFSHITLSSPSGVDAGTQYIWLVMLCIHGDKSSHSFVLLNASNFFFIPVVNSNFKYETYTFSTGTYACTGIVNNLSTFSRQKGKYCFYTYKKREKVCVSSISSHYDIYI